MKIYLDFETRSGANINTTGAFAYARHPSTEILCIGYKVKGGSVVVLTRDDLRNNSKGAQTLKALAQDTKNIFVAHNAQFEYAIWDNVLRRDYSWPSLQDPKRWNCTLARAAMCGLPISLENAGHAVNAKVQKYAEGRAILMKLCRPVGVDVLGDYIFNETPELLEGLYKYNAIDVESEESLDELLPEMPEQEKEVWALDLIVNSRGILIDRDTAIKAGSIADRLTEELNNRLRTLTNGALDRASRIKAITEFIRKKGIGIESIDKQSVNHLLSSPDIPQEIKDILWIRKQVGKSSTAKYKAMVEVADATDNRARGLLQYHGAATGRWAGRLIQPQNFPKGVGFDSDEVVRDIQILDTNSFSQKYKDKSMDALSAALRGVLMASPGHELIVADYSAIEARVLAWLADDVDILAKYKVGLNLYVDMAKYIYGRDIDKKKNPVEYAVGKAVVLGCGYGMGVKRFREQCALNGIELSEDMAFKAVDAYRKKCRRIVSLWYELERAAINAIMNPGKTYPVDKVTWGMSKDLRFLGCKLPSGRFLRYYRPSVKAIETEWGEEKQEVHYFGADIKKGENFGLSEFKTYGGALTENVTQAVARDIMANGMLNAEKKGLRVLLTVHDEIVTEAKKGEYEVEDLIKAMCNLPKWAEGCPIAAEGWKGDRYRK